MTPDRFRECLDLIGWSQRGLASMIAVDERQVRRWAAGRYAIPPPVAAWLDRVASFHALHPAPAAARTAKEGS